MAYCLMEGIPGGGLGICRRRLEWELENVPSLIKALLGAGNCSARSLQDLELNVFATSSPSREVG